MADSLYHAKRMLGHSYMSSKADMTAIVNKFADTQLDAFVMRAAAKAFNATIGPGETLNMSRVFSHGQKITYTGVQDLRVGQIAQSGVENGPLPAGENLI